MGDEDNKMKKSKLEKDSPVEEMPVAIEAPPAPVPARRVSFEQWASNKGIPTHHFRGMRAWVKDASMPRTEEAWTLAFVGY